MDYARCLTAPPELHLRFCGDRGLAPLARLFGEDLDDVRADRGRAWKRRSDAATCRYVGPKKDVGWQMADGKWSIERYGGLSPIRHPPSATGSSAASTAARSTDQSPVPSVGSRSAGAGRGRDRPDPPFRSPGPSSPSPPS